jgi:dihydropteroate synthase
MGILNVTPDSFSDGGMFLEPEAALARAREMTMQGADLIDVGGASSRPRGKAYGEGAAEVSPEEELRRVLPVVTRIAEFLPDTLISVDTFREEVAQAVLRAGAHLINDITGLRHSPGIAAIVAEAGAGLVLMHSRGTVGSMPHKEESEDVVDEVVSILRVAASRAVDAGVESLVLDPGFGFGKSVAGNLQLVNGIGALTELGYPALIGVSRKSSIGEVLGSEEDPVPPENRLFGSLGAAAVAVMRGASIVRTHDVAETAQMLRVLGRTVNSNRGRPSAIPYLDGSVHRPPPNTAHT